MALAHTIGNKVEAAYRRGKLLEKRKVMMATWADYCMGRPVMLTRIARVEKAEEADQADAEQEAGDA
jgi:hypothetical protein